MAEKPKKPKPRKKCVKKTIDGVQYRFYADKISEAKDKRDNFITQHSQGVAGYDRKITVKQWAEIWFAKKKEGLTGSSSQESYENHLDNYIYPNIGAMKLIDVRLIDIDSIMKEIYDKGFSESLQDKVLMTMNQFFRYAVKPEFPGIYTYSSLKTA